VSAAHNLPPDAQKLVDARRAPSDRPITTYTLPDDAVRQSLSKTPVRKVGMRDLTAEEERLALALGKFEPGKADHEAVKLSIVALDGRAVNNGEGEVDTFWSQCGPKARSLLTEAYERRSGFTMKEAVDFFKSAETSI
jgi:hypothetical protein